MEQQLKKAEAAQRRRMQNEKAARESEVSFCSLQVTVFFLIMYNFTQKTRVHSVHFDIFIG